MLDYLFRLSVVFQAEPQHIIEIRHIKLQVVSISLKTYNTTNRTIFFSLSVVNLVALAYVSIVAVEAKYLFLGYSFPGEPSLVHMQKPVIA